ncbi:MAG TPA: MlaD family protein [Polyangiaceae bacterium]|jgi:phospholipid/cholesterol/gamma-HCH transport system substrate-binding protein
MAAPKVSQAAKVGAFLLLVAAGAWAIYSTIFRSYGGGSGYVVHAYLDDASGLASHSRVTIAGIPVGSIDSIRLVTDSASPHRGQARVDVRVNKDVPLFSDGTLGKHSSSLLGEYVVVLTPGTKVPQLKDGDEINVVAEEASVDDIKKNINDVAKLVKQVAQQLANSVGTEQGGQNIRDILKNMADATDALNKTIRENRETIKETLDRIDRITANNEVPLNKALENIRAISEDIKNLTAAISGRGGNETGMQVRDTIAHLDTSSKSLESMLAHVDHVADRLDRGEGTLGRLSKDDTLINDVQEAAEGINNFIGPVSRLQTIVGLRADYNFLSNTFKSYFELRLQPREDKFVMIQLINDPKGFTSFTKTTTETDDPTKPAKSTTISQVTTNQFRFSLEIARQLGPVRGRFGIIESTGGIGLDLVLFNGRFELVNDLFGFAEQAVPRFRSYIAYQFINRLFLLGGVDNVFLDAQRDYFIGLQLRYDDEDLKSMLPFAGGLASGAR